MGEGIVIEAQGCATGAVNRRAEFIYDNRKPVHILSKETELSALPGSLHRYIMREVLR